MFLQPACWLPLGIFIVGYLCTWPKPATWNDVLRVDLPVLTAFVIFAIGISWLVFCSPSGINEQNGLQLWSFLFDTTTFGMIWLTVASATRYLLFRSRS